jgi:hypothetical protein
MPMTDTDRIRLATRKGNRMHGPVERQRCTKHGRRWETFRWTWPAPDEAKGETHLDMIEGDSDAEVVRQCEDCCAEDDRDMRECLSFIGDL